MERTNKESQALFNFLDSIQLSEVDIMSRVSLFSRLEAIAGAVDYQPDYQPTTISGSTMDGISWKGYMSDLDTMLKFTYVTVIDESKSPENFDGHVFLLADTNVHPGYTRLKLMKEAPLRENNIFSMTPGGAKSFCNEENGDYYLSAFKFKAAFNMYQHVPQKPPWVVQTSYSYGIEWPDEEEILEHGPSLCFTDISKEDETSNDAVPCFQCLEWPKQAAEWVTRKRGHWPSRETIDYIVSQGCRVVPVGPRGSKTRYLEWRISFAIAERELIKSFNNTQHKCYALLKMLLKEAIDAEIKDVLSSFNMKNTLLWTIENTEAELWRPERITLAFMECLNNLIKWVKDSSCPSYFVPENNVFELKVFGENEQKLLPILEKYASENWRCLLRCRTFREETRFVKLIKDESDASLALAIETYKATDSAVIWFDHDMRLFPRYEHARAELMTYLSNEDDISMAILNHLRVIQRLTGERSPTKFHAEVIQPLMLSIESSLGSHLYAMHKAEGYMNRKIEAGDFLQMAQEHLTRGKESDATSGPLKLANFYYMTGNTVGCLELTDTVLDNNHLLPTYVPQFLPTLLEPSEMQILGFKAFIESSFSMPLEDRFKTSAAHPVIFLPTEIDAVPDAVKFQLRSPIPEAMEYTYWLKWAVYDPLVYAHFLRFMCFSTVNDEENATVELESIEKMLREGAVAYEVTAFNLLGYSYVTSNDIEKATRYLLKANEKALSPEATVYQHGDSLSSFLQGGKKNKYKGSRNK
ncbi:hypothetical protein CHS0354_025438 [Potamilus streckersoni]|uniref:Uncharacterized protein n=1 Tax=Potamilus streckersoni TaxID=2493646 RepID=A0AAE0VZQ9_9BIVA|nr:hypothetical protein CHS0354_025438 [Potamilus streckersoni]